MSDRAWTRTDALNRMLAELYEMTVASDEKQHQSVMLSRKSAANSRSHTPESSGLSGVYVISVAAKLADWDDVISYSEWFHGEFQRGLELILAEYLYNVTY